MTIVIALHASGARTFKDFYTLTVLPHWHEAFPNSVSYTRFDNIPNWEQVPTRGNRISILGLWQPEQQFDYALAQGDFEGETYLKAMDWIADKAAVTLAEIGRLTVVVQDNCKIHKCELVKPHWQR